MAKQFMYRQGGRGCGESSLLVPVYLSYIEFRDKIGPVIVKHCRYKDKSFSDWLGNGVVVPRTTIMIHMRRKISTLQTCHA
jgi:hypothetical protein